jgi:hypothetical protein
VPRIDLVQVLAHADLPTHLDVLKELKKEGRVRYIGVTTIAPQYARLEAAMRDEPIDFVGVDYAVNHRGVEETILPLALERKIGVLAYFPFGTGRLFPRVGHHAPPGVGRRVRREDVGAVLPQVRRQPSGRDRGPDRDEPGDAHARQPRRRHRPPAGRGDAQAHGGAGRLVAEGRARGPMRSVSRSRSSRREPAASIGPAHRSTLVETVA